MRFLEVFVRSPPHREATRLMGMSTRLEHQSTRIRAAILLASTVNAPVPQIARMWLTEESYVRKDIHEFNDKGSAACALTVGAGDPTGSPPQRRQAIAVAGAKGPGRVVRPAWR